MGKITKLLIIVAVGLLLWFLPSPAGVKVEAWRLLAVFVATIVGFILQPLPIGSIAFISLVFCGLSGVLGLQDMLSGFSNSTIWLIVAAFCFSKGFSKTGLGRRIAYMIMKALGNSTLKLGYVMLLSDLVLAPATPSTAARSGAVLFPIVRSLVAVFDSQPGATARKIGSYLMVTTLQGNIVTCAMFLTACAPNPLMVTLAAQVAGINISWGLWAAAAFIPGMVSLLLIPLIIYKIYPPEITETPEARRLATEELEKIGPISYGEKVVCGVFILCIALWCTAQWTNLDATIVAMMGVALMLLLDAIDWNDVIQEKGAWDIMIWLGTLINLAGALNKQGLISWFAKTVGTTIGGVPWELALLILVVTYVCSHYGFASTSAHATAMYAAFLAVALAAGAPPYLAALSLAFTATLCGGITHYSTAPAPIYFGAGYVSQSDWWRIGFILALVHIVVWTVIGSAWWKILGLW